VEETFLKKMAGQAPLTADLLVNRIYSILEDNIIKMTLPPESKLTEEDIARILGVSRSPVREALMRLENSGLVVRKIGKGRVVASFTEKEVVENYEVWEMIEIFAGGLACISAQDPDYAKIEEVLSQMKRSSTTEDDFYLYRNLNYRFHSNMVNPCPNKALVRIYENALKPIDWCWNLSMLWQRTISNSYSEHEQIFDAYRRRDRTAYEKLVRQHIRDASERFCKEYSGRKNPDGTIQKAPNGIEMTGSR
jgi:DNA-binding GntR family transcriptional regulator